jgi:hypothetical protein
MPCIPTSPPSDQTGVEVSKYLWEAVIESGDALTKHIKDLGLGMDGYGEDLRDWEVRRNSHTSGELEVYIFRNF